MGKTLLFFISATLLAQTHNILLVRGTGGVPASLNVTTTSLPNTSGGTVVNLSDATQDWRLFTYPAGGCQSSSECYGDRKLGGVGMMGVTPAVGTDNNFIAFGTMPTALSISFTDGTRVSSGTPGQNTFYPGESYEIRAVADNQVSKTLTIYWGMINGFENGVPAKSPVPSETADFTVSLSDNSVTPYTVRLTADNTLNDGLKKMVIAYRAATDGQELIVTAVRNAGLTTDGNAVLSPIAAMLDSAATGPITRNVPSDADVQRENDNMFRPFDTQLFPVGYVGNNLNLTVSNSTLKVASQVIPDGQRILTTEARALIRDNGLGLPAIKIGAGVHNIKIDGFEFKPVDASGFPTNYTLIQVGVPATNASPLLSTLPADIDLGHLYIHCNPITLSGTTAIRTSNCRNGLTLDGNRVNFHDSIVKDMTWENVEANAVRVQIGQDVTIQNNELMSNGEVVLIYSAGGYAGDTRALRSGLFANNFLVTNNWIHKDLAWLHTGYEKNLLEVKNGRNGVISYNVFEDSFLGTSTDGQYGYGIVIANRTAGSTASNSSNFDQPTTLFASTQNINIHHNIMHRIGAAAFHLHGPYDDNLCYYTSSPSTLCADPTYAHIVAAVEAQGLPASLGVERGTNWNIHDNYIDGINPRYATEPGRTDGFSNRGGCLQGPGADNLTFQRNTCIFDLTPGQVIPAGTYAGFPYNTYTVVNNNGTGWEQQAAPNNFTTGTLVDSNIFGWEFNGTCTGRLGVIIGNGCESVPTSAYAAKIFTNNAILNANASGWGSITTAGSDLKIANDAAPGQYTGNTINSTVSGQGAPTLTHEAAVKAGNR